jgi:hypothetical protein
MSDSSQLSLINYEARHRPALEELFARHFGNWSAERFKRRWHWQYRSSEDLFGRLSKILLLAHGEKIVAHISGAPIPLRIDGCLVAGLAASGLAVDHQYRLATIRLVRELFSEPPVLSTAMAAPVLRLMTHAGAILIPESTVRHVMTLSLSGPLRTSLQSRLPVAAARLIPDFPYGLIGQIRGSWRKLKASLQHDRASSSIEVQPLDHFPAETDLLWTGIAKDHSWAVDRSRKYLNWRYVDCPELSAIKLGAFSRRGQLLGLAVGLRRWQLNRHREPGAVHMEVAELLYRPDNIEIGKMLLEELVMRALVMKTHSLSATGFAGATGQLLEAAGFDRYVDDRHIASLLQRSTIPLDGASSQSGYFTSGDGDSLYLSAL